MRNENQTILSINEVSSSSDLINKTTNIFVQLDFVLKNGLIEQLRPLFKNFPDEMARRMGVAMVLDSNRLEARNELKKDPSLIPLINQRVFSTLEKAFEQAPCEAQTIFNKFCEFVPDYLKAIPNHVEKKNKILSIVKLRAREAVLSMNNQFKTVLCNKDIKQISDFLFLLPLFLVISNETQLLKEQIATVLHSKSPHAIFNMMRWGSTR
ncbi:hypothetical protein [Coxiella burnetii]|uniref:hypothetical protein n=1 Tax=Coxiella burnetii TaxID=777 RepID=UPI000AF031F1|nr:hypothetical protein [Coxiella burnetii]